MGLPAGHVKNELPPLIIVSLLSWRLQNLITMGNDLNVTIRCIPLDTPEEDGLLSPAKQPNTYGLGTGD